MLIENISEHNWNGKDGCYHEEQERYRVKLHAEEVTEGNAL